MATSLVDGKRINASVRNQVSLLSEINIYGLQEEVSLREIFQRIYAKEEGNPCAVKPKAPTDELKPFFWGLSRLRWRSGILPTSRRLFSGITFVRPRGVYGRSDRSNRRKRWIAERSNWPVDRLLTIMDELREQCPWDRKQTFESLRHLTIEETYELCYSCTRSRGNQKWVGGLAFAHCVLRKLGSEKGLDMADIAYSISEKLIRRHPHIYGDVKLENEEEVKQNWSLKLKKGRKVSFLVYPKVCRPWSKPNEYKTRSRGLVLIGKTRTSVGKGARRIGEFKLRREKSYSADQSRVWRSFFRW